MKPRLLISPQAQRQQEEQTETLPTSEPEWPSFIYVAKVEGAATKSTSVMQHYEIDKRAIDD